MIWPARRVELIRPRAFRVLTVLVIHEATFRAARVHALVVERMIRTKVVADFVSHRLPVAARPLACPRRF